MSLSSPKPKTLYEKLLDSHTVEHLNESDGLRLLYIDRTVCNEYTSPQAFSLLRESGRKVRRPGSFLGTVDHVNPTYQNRPLYPEEENAAIQVRYFEKNGEDFDLEIINVDKPANGIEHVVMCEHGRVLPGMIIAAGDSHTATYGALGCLGYGIGTSDIYHYLATSCLPYKTLKTMKVCLTGNSQPGIVAKDIIMHVVRTLGASGASGFCIEFCGPAIEALSVEGRMTVCNMAVECGARSSLIAPDQKVFDYLLGKPFAPEGQLRDAAVSYWKSLKSDPGAVFDKEFSIDVSEVQPMVTWGISPDMAIGIDEKIPSAGEVESLFSEKDHSYALGYTKLKAGDKLAGTKISHAFIGSCTNSRIEDLREAAKVLKGRKIAGHVTAIVVPGSGNVARQAEEEGIAQIFRDAGWQWRLSGCSLCLAMNGDILREGDRCISSTNRNFEGRQGVGAITHLASPAMVAAASIAGHICDFRRL